MNIYVFGAQIKDVKVISVSETRIVSFYFETLGKNVCLRLF